LSGATGDEAAGHPGVHPPPGSTEVEAIMKDFFVSYNRADKQWAEWIAWTLEEAGYSVAIQAWDFRPGGNFVLDMQRAAAACEKTIAVLSQSYLDSAYTQPEWAAAFANDPQSLQRKLMPIRVGQCKPDGMLRPIVYIDLIGLSELEAEQAVLEAMRDRAKPSQKPAFPGSVVPERAMPEKATFPGTVPGEPAAAKPALSRVQQIKAKALQEQLESLSADYEAVSKQLSYTTNAGDRNKLQRQMEAIEREMTEVEVELSALGYAD